MTLVVTEAGKILQVLEKKGYSKEKELQDILKHNPDIIPVHEISNGSSFIFTRDEFPTEHGSIDIVGIDDQGNIYVIETKLKRNVTRREIIAQALDYAASLWLSYRDRFDDFINAVGFNKYEAEEEILKELRSNLEKGSFKVLVAMDNLDDQVKNIIHFLNQTTNLEIYALEMERYTFRTYEILVPKLYGAESKDQSPSRKRGAWNEEKFFKELNRNVSKEVFEAAKDFFSFLKDQGFLIKWGSGKEHGSFNVVIDVLHPTKSLVTVWASGNIQINFGGFKELEEEKLKKVHEFAMRLKEEGFNIPQDYLSKYPPQKPEIWVKKLDVSKALLVELRDSLT